MGLLIVLCVNFAVGYLIGFAATRIPVFSFLFRWPILIYWIYTGVQYSDIVLTFWSQNFCIYWGVHAAYLRYIWVTHLRHAPAIHFPQIDLSFLAPRSSSYRESSSGDRFGWIGKAFGWTFRSLGGLLYFIFFRFPVHLIRLFFWLRTTMPKLKTADGWWMLFKGLLIWIGDLLWKLLPFSWRAEIRRGMTGKTVQDSFADEMRGHYQREQERERRRQENEYAQMYRKAKDFFRSKARSNEDPFEQGNQTEQSSQRSSERYDRNTGSHQQDTSSSSRGSSRSTGSSESENFQREQQRRAEEARRRREREEQEARSRRQQSSGSRQSSQSQQSQDPFNRSGSDNSWWNQQQQGASGGSRRTTGSQGQSSASQSQGASSSKPLDPRSKAYFDLHKAEFDQVGWIYDSMEERFVSDSTSAYTVLGVSTSATKKEVKKAKQELAKRFMKYSLPTNPVKVIARAEEILKVVNGASDKLLRAMKNQ